MTSQVYVKITRYHLLSIFIRFTGSAVLYHLLLILPYSLVCRLLPVVDTDHVSSDRQVLLAAFQIQNMLIGSLYGKVMTFVDLKNESNMFFLQQNVCGRFF